MKTDIMAIEDPAPSGGGAESRPPKRMSEIFASLAEGAEAPITIDQVRNELGDRSFAALLVLFAAFNLLPLPPGSTLIFGVPLMLISGQMMLGYRSAWLPRMMLDKSIAPERFRAASARLIPLLTRLERMVKPRKWPFATRTADRWIGIAAFILSVAVFLPIPLGNWLPAFSVATIGLALSERDGVLLAAGLTIGLVSLLIIAAVVGTAGIMASAVFGGPW